MTDQPQIGDLDAFRRARYRRDDRSEIHIWNRRRGPAPRMIPLPDGTCLTRVRCDDEPVDRGYQPDPEEAVLVDLHLSRVPLLAAMLVDQLVRHHDAVAESAAVHDVDLRSAVEMLVLREVGLGLGSSELVPATMLEM